MENLKKPTVVGIFQAWLEDWEKDLVQVNDCVTKARLLEKYKHLLLYDLDTEKTFKMCAGKLRVSHRWLKESYHSRLEIGLY